MNAMADMREFLRRRKEAKEMKEAKAPPPAPEVPPVRPAPPSEPGPAPEALDRPARSVTYSCGCKVGARQFRTHPCPGCARKLQEARAERKEPRGGGGRLPDGSSFNVVYDAAKVSWSGSLTVPLADGPRRFEAQASGVMKLLRELDRLYRAACDRPETTP
jgi:hypothetical protein